MTINLFTNYFIDSISYFALYCSIVAVTLASHTLLHERTRLPSYLMTPPRLEISTVAAICSADNKLLRFARKKKETRRTACGDGTSRAISPWRDKCLCLDNGEFSDLAGSSRIARRQHGDGSRVTMISHGNIPASRNAHLCRAMPFAAPLLIQRDYPRPRIALDYWPLTTHLLFPPNCERTARFYRRIN